MAEVETYVINERPLTDDTLTLAPDGHVFKGGYVAIVTYHTFKNSQSDEAHVRRFRSMTACEAFIKRRYGKTWEELVWSQSYEDYLSDEPDQYGIPDGLTREEYERLASEHRDED